MLVDDFAPSGPLSVPMDAIKINPRLVSVLITAFGKRGPPAVEQPIDDSCFARMGGWAVCPVAALAPACYSSATRRRSVCLPRRRVIAARESAVGRGLSRHL